MNTTTVKLTTLEIVYSDRTIEVITVTPLQYAGLKRSNQWKKRVAVKKICEITIITKTL